MALCYESKDKSFLLDVIKKMDRQQGQSSKPSALLSLQDNILMNLEIQLCKLRHKRTNFNCMGMYIRITMQKDCEKL